MTAVKKSPTDAKKSAPAKKAGTTKKSPPARNSAPVKNATPVKKSPPAKSSAPAKRATPAKASTAKTPTKKATVTKSTPVKKSTPVAKKPAAAAKHVAPATKTAATKAVATKAAVTKAAATKATATKATGTKAAAAAKVASAAAATAVKEAPAPFKATRKPIAEPPKRPTVGPYAKDAKFLDAQRVLLHEERTIYAGQAVDLRAEADSLALEREPGDVQFDEESGEGGTVTVDRERNLALSAQASAAVEEIDDALKKIDRKYYGGCERCFQPIPKARLQALPFARLCVACKSGGLSRR